MRTETNTAEMCLSLDEMSAYLGHRLEAGQEALVDRHLQHCLLCCGALESLEQNTNSSENRPVNLKKLERDFKDELRKQGRVETKDRFGWLKYAAVVIVLLLPVYLVYDVLFTSGSRELAVRYFEPYEDMISVRSDMSLAPSLAEAMELYNKGAYKEAVRHFETVLQTEPQNDLVRLYSGISLMQSGNAEEARAHFEQIIENRSLVTDQARWYLALTFLLMEDERQAADILRELSKHEPYQGKAQELLDKL